MFSKAALLELVVSASSKLDTHALSSGRQLYRSCPRPAARLATDSVNRPFLHTAAASCYPETSRCYPVALMSHYCRRRRRLERV
jgi:hypothetical protein